MFTDFSENLTWFMWTIRLIRSSIFLRFFLIQLFNEQWTIDVEASYGSQCNSEEQFKGWQSSRLSDSYHLHNSQKFPNSIQCCYWEQERERENEVNNSNARSPLNLTTVLFLFCTQLAPALFQRCVENCNFFLISSSLVVRSGLFSF